MNESSVGINHNAIPTGSDLMDYIKERDKNSFESVFNNIIELLKADRLLVERLTKEISAQFCINSNIANKTVYAAATLIITEPLETCFKEALARKTSDPMSITILNSNIPTALQYVIKELVVDKGWMVKENSLVIGKPSTIHIKVEAKLTD